MKDIEEHLRYLHMVALKTLDKPLMHRRKIKKMISMSNKYQIRLSREIKRTLCFKCYRILVPGVSCTSRIVRRGCGLCVVTTCSCRNEKAIVMQSR